MHTKFKIVKVDYKYCDYLRKYDYRVPYNAGSKDLRPFIGVLFTVNDCEYFAPLSSPKPKHKNLKNKLDLIKIKNGEYGVINLNNMIPVTSNNYTEINLNKKPKTQSEILRYRLLNKQLRWLLSNKEEVTNKATFLYKLYKDDNLSKSVKDRCCDFVLLEEKCSEYNTVNV